MTLCIKRIQTDVTPPIITILPGHYEDRGQAEQALKGILMGYKHSGENEKGEQGTWWAREKNGQTFTFVIDGATPEQLAESNPAPR